MNEVTRGAEGFTGYEYRDVTVRRAVEPIYADGYENFGWKLEGTGLSINNVGSVVMKFKRDRRIRNKAELTRLQRQFDACAEEIVALENSKGIKASAAAYGIGIAGCAFLAGSVFAFLEGMLPLMVVLAIPGFAGWILPYFCYLGIRRKKTAEVTPLIDGKYDEIYEVCEKAHAMLTA